VEGKAESQGSLEGKVVIVTGGASGIGRATCIELARQGARPIVVDIDQGRVEELVGVLQTQAAMGIVANVKVEQDMHDMVRKVLERYGRIDVLVHCAGILRMKGSGPKFLHQVSLEEWNAVIDTNLKGTFISSRSVVPIMIKQKSGQIINISSTSGLKGRAFDAVYCASKFGMIGLSEAMAEEVRSYGVRVHVVLPDAVDTPIWEQNLPVRAPEDSLSPERIASVIVYLMGLPEDTVLDHLVIRPFRGRRRHGKTDGRLNQEKR
jgi:NAD(P)-dependent dehydrogenase (short-subunit alcohol dehydrogenase family)